ncbi:MAG: L-rhamnose mutarotase [Bacteroidales bacterium]
MMTTTPGGTTKRYCKTMDLESDPVLVAAYRKVHGPGQVWPEITAGMREVGIVDMEIYLLGTRLFMIMETVPGFDPERDLARLAALPRQSEWEAHVARYQRTESSATASEKWQDLERIYKMDEP